MNADTERFDPLIQVRITFARSNTTENYCSVASIWTVTLRIPPTDPKNRFENLYKDHHSNLLLSSFHLNGYT